MTLILRKCKSDGSSRNGFKYGQVGARVSAPDWDPKPKCGNGLHGLKEGNGDWSLLEGDDWLIIDADDLVVDIDEERCKFNTGIILFRGTAKHLSKSEFPHKLNLNENSAYQWARSIGNKDIMSKKIKSEEYAYKWARWIGNKNVMIKKIKSEKYAFVWARDIGNSDSMIFKITDSEYAYYWARCIGDENVMKSKVTNKYWIETWNFYFPNNKIES